jgi:bis(5'-adenosyl)-triphosphatase
MPMIIPDIQPIVNCIFCNKEITDNSFYSTVQFSALYNIAPVLPGHSLIIPNKHYTSLFELSDNELGDMMIFARKITTVLKAVFNCNGFDWTIQDGVSAGQTIPHLHLHIIPRKPLDIKEGDEWYSKIPGNESQMLDSLQRKRLNDHEYRAITEKLAKATAILLPSG